MILVSLSIDVLLILSLIHPPYCPLRVCVKNLILDGDYVVILNSKEEIIARVVMDSLAKVK